MKAVWSLNLLTSIFLIITKVSKVVIYTNKCHVNSTCTCTTIRHQPNAKLNVIVKHLKVTCTCNTQSNNTQNKKVYSLVEKQLSCTCI